MLVGGQVVLCTVVGNVEIFPRNPVNAIIPFVRV